MRLIDADELIEQIEKRLCHAKTIVWLCRIIGEVPTIEVEKRCDMCKIMKTGQGRIRLYDGNGWQVAIGRGVGGYELVISHLGEHFATKIDYCPYCGAKMEGKNEDGVD